MRQFSYLISAVAAAALMIGPTSSAAGQQEVEIRLSKRSLVRLPPVQPAQGAPRYRPTPATMETTLSAYEEGPLFADEHEQSMPRWMPPARLLTVPSTETALQRPSGVLPDPGEIIEPGIEQKLAPFGIEGDLPADVQSVEPYFESILSDEVSCACDEPLPPNRWAAMLDLMETCCDPLGIMGPSCDLFDLECGPLRGVYDIFSTRNATWYDQGIGRERLVQAPFEIDTTQPHNNILLRLDAVNNFILPDRSEYLFARPVTLTGRGPPIPELSASYQDFRFSTEMGGKRFSVATEVPIRILDPQLNANTAGFGDMQIVTKALMLDYKRWQITHLMRTFIGTGAPMKGLGVSHTSMEQGVLCRYQWTDITYIHSEIVFWYPLGGHPTHAGEMIRWGLGVSHLLFETDRYALIPTLEFVSNTYLDGQVSDPFNMGVTTDVDGLTYDVIYPGIRLVTDTSGKFTFVEYGLSGGIKFGGSSGWFDSMLRIDMRLVY